MTHTEHKEAGQKILARMILIRQTTQDLRVDSIAEGDQQTEWFAEKQVEDLDRRIKDMRIQLATRRG